MDYADLATRLAVSLLPVLLFLGTINYLDSFRLVNARALLLAIVVGAGVALLSLTANNALVHLGAPRELTTRHLAPAIEEILKAALVIVLIRRKRVGFPVDAAILGFAVGAGFALIENTYYIRTLQSSGMVVWVVRGLGTAIMHGGVTAIFGIISKTLADRAGTRWWVFLPGLAVAVFLHSFYNHFMLPPMMSTVVLHIVLPALLLLTFWLSERSTRRWLGTQLDVDAELLEIINEGRISESRIGHFVETLRQQFPPEMVIDILCYLRIHVELAISAKGLLMMRDAGFNPPLPDGTREKFTELRHLERTIGVTGRMAVAPFLHQSTRDLWQIYMLDQ